MVNTKSLQLLPLFNEAPKQLPETRLPSCREMILEFLWQKRNHSKPNASFNYLKAEPIKKVIKLYGKVPQLEQSLIKLWRLN